MVRAFGPFGSFFRSRFERFERLERAERFERLFFDLPVGERLRAGLDVGDIRIAVPGRDVARLLGLVVLPPRCLLLAAFDERFLALALRGGWSCVSGHAELSAYTISTAIPNALSILRRRVSMLVSVCVRFRSTTFRPPRAASTIWSFARR